MQQLNSSWMYTDFVTKLTHSHVTSNSWLKMQITVDTVADCTITKRFLVLVVLFVFSLSLFYVDTFYTLNAVFKDLFYLTYKFIQAYKYIPEDWYERFDGYHVCLMRCPSSYRCWIYIFVRYKHPRFDSIIVPGFQFKF